MKYLELNRWQLQHSTMVCCGMASNSVGASEVAKAVITFLGFSSSDQQDLLEVFEDYFTSPADAEEDNDLENDSCTPGSTHSLEGAVV